MTLQDGYRAIHERAAIGAVAPRRPLAVAGQDRAAYLQGLLTNDIASLAPGTGCYSAWLSPQGRMLTDMHVLESGSLILLDVPAETHEATLARLEQFIFTEDVHVASLGESLAGVWVHGPAAPAVIEAAVDLPELRAWPEYRHARAEHDGHAVSVVRISQLGVPGFCLYVERAHEAALLAALGQRGAERVAQEAIDAARIEAAYPVYGADLTEDTIPLEAGIESRAISFTKGCYVGQEVIIRVLHRGHGRVARRLVSLRAAGDPPPPGSRLFAGDKEIGLVTSAARSPASGGVALGYVHRDFVTPGTLVEAEMAGGRSALTVSASPIRAAV